MAQRTEDVWKFSTTELGELFVAISTISAYMKPKCFATNWASGKYAYSKLHRKLLVFYHCLRNILHNTAVKWHQLNCQMTVRFTSFFVYNGDKSISVNK